MNEVSVFNWFPKKTAKNSYGGLDYLAPNGSKIGYSKPNSYGGLDYHAPNGSKLGYSKPNYRGESDMYKPNGSKF